MIATKRRTTQVTGWSAYLALHVGRRTASSSTTHSHCPLEPHGGPEVSW